MKNYIYLFFIVCLFSIGCIDVNIGGTYPDTEPEIPELTEATMEGKHTLSFLLDGEVWVSDRGWGDLSSQVSVSEKYFSVSARRRPDFKSDHFGFSFVLQDFTPNPYPKENTTFDVLFAGGG